MIPSRILGKASEALGKAVSRQAVKGFNKNPPVHAYAVGRSKAVRVKHFKSVEYDLMMQAKFRAKLKVMKRFWTRYPRAECYHQFQIRRVPKLTRLTKVILGIKFYFIYQLAWTKAQCWGGPKGIKQDVIRHYKIVNNAMPAHLRGK